MYVGGDEIVYAGRGREQAACGQLQRRHGDNGYGQGDDVNALRNMGLQLVMLSCRCIELPAL
jgi:hypothetical protein